MMTHAWALPERRHAWRPPENRLPAPCRRSSPSETASRCGLRGRRVSSGALALPRLPAGADVAQPRPVLGLPANCRRVDRGLKAPRSRRGAFATESPHRAPYSNGVSGAEAGRFNERQALDDATLGLVLPRLLDQNSQSDSTATAPYARRRLRAARLSRRSARRTRKCIDKMYDAPRADCLTFRARHSPQ